MLLAAFVTVASITAGIVAFFTGAIGSGFGFITIAVVAFFVTSWRGEVEAREAEWKRQAMWLDIPHGRPTAPTPWLDDPDDEESSEFDADQAELEARRERFFDSLAPAKEQAPAADNETVYARWGIWPGLCFISLTLLALFAYILITRPQSQQSPIAMEDLAVIAIMFLAPWCGLLWKWHRILAQRRAVRG